MGAAESTRRQSYIEVAFQSELGRVRAEADKGMRNNVLNRALGTLYKIYYSPDQSLGQADFDIQGAMAQIKGAAIANGIGHSEADKTDESAHKYGSSANWVPKNSKGKGQRSSGWTPAMPVPAPIRKPAPPKPVPIHQLNSDQTYYVYPRFNERKVGKKSGWQHQDSNGQWFLGRASDQPVFYNEPTDWSAWEGARVVILEGEKDVNTLTRLQDPDNPKVLFMSGAFGATSSKMPFDLLPKDAEVYFFYDADKAGRVGAEETAQRCANMRADLSVYRHADEGDTGHDATDAFEQGGRQGVLDWYTRHMSIAKARGRIEGVTREEYESEPIHQPPEEMTSKTSTAKKQHGGPKRDRYKDLVESVASDMIKQIEAGTAPWQRPWEPGQRQSPHNLATGRDYHGLNQIRLWALTHAMGYPDTRWATYNQIKAAGGQVRKGEKGSFVYAWFENQPEARKAEEARRAAEGNAEPVRKKFAVKVYPIFNVSQADGIALYEHIEPTWDPCEIAEQIVKNSGVEIRHGGDRAFYNASQDYIQMPHQGQFEEMRDYYLVLMHELGHATGHKDRMNRDTLGQTAGVGVGDQRRAMEELRAEMSAMMTCTRIGLGHRPQHAAAYIESWSQLLKDTPQEIRLAATDAGKMSTYLLQGMGKGIKLDLEWETVEQKDQEFVEQRESAANVKGTPPAEMHASPLPNPRPGGELNVVPHYNVTGEPPATPKQQVGVKEQKSRWSMER